MKKYAIRILSNKHHTYVQLNVEVQRQSQEEGGGSRDHDVTIGEVFEEQFPRLFEKSLSDEGDLEITKKRDFEMLVQGVALDMKTPLYWMQLNLSDIDNFLYVCFHFN